MSKRSERRAKARAAAKSVNLVASKPGEAMPPAKGAPTPTWPVAVEERPGALAPVPLVDRFPLVIGQQLTVSYIASVFRLATTGYRQQLVDLLNELMEQDPHLFSVVLKRILSSAVGRVEITACKLPEGHPDTDAAEDLARFVEMEIGRIPDLTGSLSMLLWAVYYGLSASEIYWTRDGDGWHIDRLGFIHSRRLSYPDYQSWSAYVWDQGQVYGWASAWGTTATNTGVFGLRIADWPGKFILHQPQLRGDYPTRDGIGRQTAVWAAFKRIGGRGASDYLERFAKSFMDVSYSTTNEGKPREATEEDIALAAQIAAAIGPGSGSYGSHADSIQINPLSFDGGSSSKLTWQEWIGLCNAEMSKAALGGTLGTEVGKGGGNRALGEVQERAEIDLEKYDAKCLAETLRRDVVAWLVRLNRPQQIRLLPQVNIHVDPDPDPKTILELAEKLTGMGAPVDLDRTADDVGIALIENDDDMPPRRSYRAGLEQVVKALTQVDYPVDLDALAKVIGVPIVALEDIAKARRSRLVTGGKDMPVEPDGSNDPNSPDYVDPESVDTTTVKVKTRGKPPAKGGDGAASKLNAHIRGALTLSDREDRKEAVEVFDQLLEDYPKRSLAWVLSAHWTGPQQVPLDRIDFTTRNRWRASHEDVTPYIDRIKAGRQKPVILVKTPGNPNYIIVDGHHRTLAHEKLGWPVLAYIATVHTDKGPWDELHAAQKKGSSKGSWDPSGTSYLS